MNPIKLISLNVALFEANNQKLIKFFKEQKPDIVCLQEVTKKVDSTAHNEFISINAIDESTHELPYSFFGPNWIMRDFKMENFHGKEHFNVDFHGFFEIGNYIKSKYKIYKGQNIFLLNHYTYVTDWGIWPKEESRAVQISDILIDNQHKIRAMNYHGIWSRDKKDSDETISACRRICQLGRAVPYPVIITGDFNLFPDTASIKLLNNHFINLADKYDIKTTRPRSNELNDHKRNVVDYIFVSRGIKTIDFNVVESDVSDHLPLIFTFKL